MIERYRLAFERVGLPAWFVAIDLLWIAKPDVLGIDARHYQRGARPGWRAATRGRSPSPGSRTPGPHTLLFYAPDQRAAADGRDMGLAAGRGRGGRLARPSAGAAAVVAGLPALAPRRLERQSADDRAGPPRPGQPLVGAVAAVGLKLYAAIPLLTRWRHLVIAGAVIAAVTLILPWQLYLDRGWASAATCRRPGTAAHGGSRSSSRRRSSPCGSCAARVPSGSRSRPSSRRRSSTTLRPVGDGRHCRAPRRPEVLGPARRDRAGGRGGGLLAGLSCRDHGTGAPSTSLRGGLGEDLGGWGALSSGTSRSVRGWPYCATST